VHVDVKSRMEEERRKTEELKKLTARAPEETTYRVRIPQAQAPRLSLTTLIPQAVGKTMGRAGQRHQLSTLLKDAQANRAALEERFARDKRTKKESGGKYGELFADILERREGSLVGKISSSPPRALTLDLSMC
jgi:hypothetical protein